MKQRLHEAYSRRVQSTVQNRHLHKRRGKATDVLLHHIKQSKDKPEPCTAQAAGMPSIPVCTSLGGVAILVPPEGPGSAGGDSDELGGSGCTRIMGSTDLGDGSADHHGLSCPAPTARSIAVACLRPSDVLAAASDGSDSGTCGSAVGAADIHAVEEAVQRVAVQLVSLRNRAAERAGVPAAAVRWLLEAPYCTHERQPLTFSTACVSSSCWASQHAFSLVANLETCFLTAALDPSTVLCAENQGARRPPGR